MHPAMLSGVATGLATGAWMYAEYALGLHNDSASVGHWTGFIALLFPVIGAYWLARHAPTSGLLEVLRQGAAFGLSGGLVGGAAIFAYFTWTNPKFAIEGQKVDAATQALVGFSGALILGIVLVPIMQALRRRRDANG